MDGKELPAELFAAMTGISLKEGENAEGIASEINNVARDPKFGEAYKFN